MQILNLPLIPDPHADQEMATRSVSTISDTELAGCRILVVCQTLKTENFENGPGAVIQLNCTFQPTVGMRFSYAQFWLQLQSPSGIYFLDIAPKVIDDPNPVEFSFDRKGSISFKSLPLPVEPSLELGAGMKYTRYHCLVQGSGVGTELARWDFRENPARKDGIGLEQLLSFTLPITGKIEGKVMVSARVARPGLQGAVDAFRDLILGNRMEDRAYPFQLDIPAE